MRRSSGVRAVLACLALAAAPLLAAPASDDHDPAGLPVLDLTLRDDAVTGLAGVVEPGPAALRVTNAGSSDRSLVVERLDGDTPRVVAHSASLVPGAWDVVVVRFGPGRWLAAEEGVSRAPAAATLVPAPAPGAPR
ncbi:MAG TPA: hypothetical protein VL422_09150 [Miltoncostaea sp.]|nr:hypothetical protein [Miltoncostaea sp.]